MKKILNVLTAITVISSGVSNVISCSNDKNKEEKHNILYNSKIDLTKAKWLQNFNLSTNSQITVESSRVSAEIKKYVQDEIIMHWDTKYGTVPTLNKDYEIKGIDDRLSTKNFTIYKDGNKNKVSDYKDIIWKELSNLTGFAISDANFSFVNDQTILNDKSYTEVNISSKLTMIPLKESIYIKLMDKNTFTDANLNQKLSSIGLTLNLDPTYSKDKNDSKAIEELKNQYGIELNNTAYTYTWGQAKDESYSNYYSFWTKESKSSNKDNTLKVSWSAGGNNYSSTIHFINTNKNETLTKGNTNAINFWNQNLTVDSVNNKTLKLLNHNITVKSINNNKMTGSTNIKLHLEDQRFNIISFDNKNVYSKLESDQPNFKMYIDYEIHEMLEQYNVNQKDYEIKISSDKTKADIIPKKDDYGSSIYINDAINNYKYFNTPDFLPVELNIIITNRLPLPKLNNIQLFKYEPNTYIHDYSNLTTGDVNNIKTSIKFLISKQVYNFQYNKDWKEKDNKIANLSAVTIFNSFKTNSLLDLNISCLPNSLNYYGSQHIKLKFIYDLSKLESSKKDFTFKVDDNAYLNAKEATQLNKIILDNLLGYFKNTLRLDYTYNDIQPGPVKDSSITLKINPNTKTNRLINSVTIKIKLEQK